ncbi:hypothetical protein JCM10449v2_004789 [Rhodotorula kratochvilovae]
MPFIDVDNFNLRTYYTINPRYADLSMSIKTPPPPCDDAIDPSKPILVFCHAGTSSSNSFIYQFRDPRLREALNLVSWDSRYYGRTGGEPLDHFQTLEVKLMILISPSFVTDPPIVSETLTREWRPACAVNKNGNGDGSGRLSEEAMAVVGDYFFSGAKHMAERQEAFLEQYQETHGPGQDMFKIDQLLFWFRREAPPPEVFAAVKCPILLLGGSLDQTVSSEGSLQDWRDRLVGVPAEDKHINTIAGGSHYLATTDSNLVNRFSLAFLKRYNFV